MMKHISISIDDISKAPIVRLDGKQVDINYIEYIHDENTSTVCKARLKIVYFGDDGNMQTLTIESPYEINGENKQ